MIPSVSPFLLSLIVISAAKVAVTVDSTGNAIGTNSEENCRRSDYCNYEHECTGRSSADNNGTYSIDPVYLLLRCQ